MSEIAICVAACAVTLMVSASLFHIAARLGPLGLRLCELASTAPWLDAVVCYFTTGPIIGAIILWSVRREPSFVRLVLLMIGSIVAQGITLIGWSRLHEVLHPSVRREPGSM